MTAKKKVIGDPKHIFSIKPMFIALCGNCEWYFTADTPDTGLDALNEHLKHEHCGEEDAYTDSRILIANRQVQLGLEEQRRLILVRK